MTVLSITAVGGVERCANNMNAQDGQDKNRNEGFRIDHPVYPVHPCSISRSRNVLTSPFITFSRVSPAPIVLIPS